MKYPSKIQEQLEEVEDLIKSWSVHISFDQVLQWIMQFDNDDFDLAIRILKNLNVIGFKELNKGLEIAYSKLERKAIEAGTRITQKNTIFAGIGEYSKSGNMISYNFRLTNSISEDNFKLDEKTLEYLEAGEIKNIVLIDDILSTGTSVLKEVKKLTEKTIPLKVENIFVSTAVGMSDGIEKVKEETKGKVHIFSAFEYDSSDTVMSLDSKFYEGIPYQNRIKVKEQLEYYGKIIYPKGKLGFGSVGGLIVFYYNTPNTTIPLVWGHNNSWIPLFKRATRLTGISAHYKEFDKAINKKVKNQLNKVKNSDELTIYVEGTTDEIFFECQIEKLNNELDFKKIDVISLGGFMSKKLIENLGRITTTKFLFIAESSPFEPKGYTARIKDNINELPHLYMKPFIGYVNIDALYLDEDFTKYLPKEEELLELDENEKLRIIERHLRRRGLSMKKNLISSIIEKHGNKSEIDKLFASIKEKVKNT